MENFILPLACCLKMKLREGTVQDDVHKHYRHNASKNFHKVTPYFMIVCFICLFTLLAIRQVLQ
jgi:hypothetical protein